MDALELYGEQINKRLREERRNKKAKTRELRVKLTKLAQQLQEINDTGDWKLYHETLSAGTQELLTLLEES